MEQCNHEEADTRVLLHLLHALQTSSSLGMVPTGDIDVVVILLSNFHHIKAVNSAAEIWVSFKAGKSTTMISLNSIAANLGTTTCKAMALFHAFTGSDSTSSFKFKGKRYCCKLMNKVPSLMEEFATVVDNPFQTSPRLKEVASNFVCMLYSNEPVNDIDHVRIKLFSQKTRDVERIRPTSDALDLHLKRSVLQASTWTTADMSMMPVNKPYWSRLEGRRWHAHSNVDLTASCQWRIQPGREVHLQKCMLFVQVHEGKLEVPTSVQVHVWEVAGQDQFPILTKIVQFH